MCVSPRFPCIPKESPHSSWKTCTCTAEPFRLNSKPALDFQSRIDQICPLHLMNCHQPPQSDRTSLRTFCASLSPIRPLDTLHKQSILPILLVPALFGLTSPDTGWPRCPKWPNPLQRACSRHGTRRSPTRRDCHYLRDKIDVFFSTPQAGCITVACE